MFTQQKGVPSVLRVFFTLVYHYARTLRVYSGVHLCTSWSSIGMVGGVDINATERVLRVEKK